MANNWESGIKYLGDTRETEAAEIKALVNLVNIHIQRISDDTNQLGNHPQRMKSLAVTNAIFKVSRNITDELRVGFLSIPESYDCF